MKTDNSTLSPGLMGWTATVEEELAYWGAMITSMEGAESLLTRHEAKPVASPTVLDAVVELQSEGGIDDGFGHRYLWEHCFGSFPTWLAQIIGSCVGSGWMRACSFRSLVEVVLLGSPEETLGTEMRGKENNINFFAPYSYNVGRYIGGIRGGDGSFCGAHIEGHMTYGAIPCNTPGLESPNYPEPQNASVYRQMGDSSSFRNEFKPAAADYKLLESERITDAEDLWELQVEHFKTAMICSNWAFRPSHQHPTWTIDGEPVWVYKRDTQRSWAHNMTLSGAYEVDGTQFQEVTNSWGANAHKNGDFFVIEMDEADRWLRVGKAEARTIGDLQLPGASLPVGW